MDSKKIRPIIYSVAIAVLCTFVLWSQTNKATIEASKTVTIVAADKFIPAYTEIKEGQLTDVAVPAKMADQFIQKKEELIGRALLTSTQPGNWIFKNQVTDSLGVRSGYVAIGVKVDISKSDLAVAEDIVDLYLPPVADKDSKIPLDEYAKPVLENIRVRASYDNNGEAIIPGGKGSGEGGAVLGSKNLVPTMVELEVPVSEQSKIARIVQNDGKIHLVKKPVAQSPAKSVAQPTSQPQSQSNQTK